MKYLSVAEARNLPGMRLVLTAHVPGPWGESAKAIFRARQVPFVAVEQVPMASNDELRAWTGGVRNAPIAMLDEDPPVTNWLDLLMLAERLGAGPSLLPQRAADRALALGLSAEICAPGGIGWSRRLILFEVNYTERSPDVRVMLQQYGYTPGCGSAARSRLVDILSMLTERLRRQKHDGSDYLVADRLTACDLHWACFSQMLAPLPPADCPMPAWLYEKYGTIDPVVAAALDPLLIEHRNRIYQRHIGLPLDF